jgi:hypothetical protein
MQLSDYVEQYKGRICVGYTSSLTVTVQSWETDKDRANPAFCPVAGGAKMAGWVFARQRPGGQGMVPLGATQLYTFLRERFGEKTERAAEAVMNEVDTSGLVGDAAKELAIRRLRERGF